jgi:tetratricopeptide (TPR) repeat protein
LNVYAIILILFTINSFFSNRAFSQHTDSSQIKPEEALFVRRILEFCKDKENAIVKSQINQFFFEYPESVYKDSLLVILGDTLWKEKNFSDALEAYTAIQAPAFRQKVFNNRLDCLYHLGRYQELATELEPKLKNINEDSLNAQEALWAYYKAETLLKIAKLDKDLSNRQSQYDQASSLLKKLFATEHKENAKLALIEIEQEQGNPEAAVRYYLELAQEADASEKKEEWLLQAAQLQGNYAPKEAVILLDQIQNTQGKAASEAALHKLILFFEQGEYQKILDGKEGFSKILEPKQQAILNLYMGRSYFNLKNYEEALNYFRPLLKPENHLANLDANLYKTILLMGAASARHLNDLTLVEDISKQFNRDYPHDLSYAKILYLKALILHHRNQLQDAYAVLQKIYQDYPTFEKRENVLFEISLLLHKIGDFEKSRSGFNELIEQSVDPSLKLAAFQYLPFMTLNQLEGAEEKGEACDNLRELLLVDLKKAINTPGVIKPTQKPAYLLKMAKVYYDMQKYQEAIDILTLYLNQYSHDENVFQGHLLLAMCYHEGLQDLQNFSVHAEKALELKPEFSDQCRLRLNLFSTYLQIAKNGNGTADEITELTDKAVEHLYKVFKIKSGQIKLENQLWMADYFYNKVKKQANEYFIDALVFEESIDFARRAESIYQNIFLNENLFVVPLSQDKINLEHELFKLSNLYGWLNELDSQLKVLNHLINQQQANPDWAWALRSRTIFSKANALQRIGDIDIALQHYHSLMTNSKFTDSFISNATKLQWARLSFIKLPQANRTLENPTMMQILKMLKDLQMRKVFTQEPVHLEAAIDYACIRASLEPEDERAEEQLFLFNRIKSDFTSNDDLWSKEYQTSRRENASQEIIYQAYMMLIDAHLQRLEGQLADKKGNMLEKEAKLETAQAIYRNLINKEFAVSKYLIDQAKSGLDMISSLE